MNDILYNNIVGSSAEKTACSQDFRADEPCSTCAEDHGHSATPYFRRWSAAKSSGFNTTNGWKLDDRKVRTDEKPAAYYVEVEELNSYVGFQGLRWDQLLEEHGKKYFIKKNIPLYQIDQTTAARIRPRTKACIRFAKLFGFDPNKHIQELRPGDWTTFEADLDAAKHHHKNLFDLSKITQHLNCKKVYGGFVRDRTRSVYLDLDYHGGGSQPVFLKIVRMVLEEMPGLMEQLGGYALHHQIANMDAQGIHTGFILGRRQDAKETEAKVREWLRGLDSQYPELLNEAVAHSALAYMEPEKPNTHTFGRIEVYPTDYHGFRLPLCWDRTMLLDRPLPLLDNGTQDVVGFMKFIENSQAPMKIDDVIDYLQARMGRQEIHEPCPRTLKRAAGSGGLTATKASLAPKTQKFVWKYQYRKNLIQFWCGINCPAKSLDEIIAVHARIAPYFRTEDEAKDTLKQFVREIPKEGWGCSSRLAKRDFKRIDKNVDWAVARAFGGNENQRDAAESKQKLDEVAKRFKQIGFDPFSKDTWHQTYTRYKIEVEWLPDDLIDFHRDLKPLLGSAKHVDVVDVVNKAIGLIVTKEKEENGIALPYWRSFFEDQFGIACGDKMERKHQKLVHVLVRLDIIAVHQRPMFNNISGEKGLATRYTTGRRLNERMGWRTRLLSEEELLEEVFGQ